MPRIDILEQDLTRATGSVTTDIPFIPGFANIIAGYFKTEDAEWDDNKTYYTIENNNYVVATKPSKTFNKSNYYEAREAVFGKAIKCSSMSDFDYYFGPNPYCFANKQTTLEIDKDDVDKSYIMARELLAKDMPVYYYAVKPQLITISRISNTTFGVDSTNTSLEVDAWRPTTTDAQLAVQFKLHLTRPASQVKLDFRVVHEDLTCTVIPGAEMTNKDTDIEYLNTKAFNYEKGLLSTEDGTDFTDCALNLIVMKKSNVQELDTTKDMKFSIEMKADDNDITNFYEDLKSYFSLSYDAGDDCLLDRSEYDIKYITTGGYPNFNADASDITSLYTLMANIAGTRGDCVAFVEDVDSEEATLSPTSNTSFFNCLQNAAIEYDEFATAFIPWAYHNITSGIKDYENKVMTSAYLPACFNYLKTLASNIKTSSNWLAMAGTTRGLVPGIQSLRTTERLSNVIADKYQPSKASEGLRAVNAVTDIKPYGLCIWGNRTLKKISDKGLTGTSFLNTRNMISDIKKLAYQVAKGLIFEQNDETLWLNFKSQMSPFLDQLKSGAGLSDYKLLKLPTHYNGSSLGKEELACAIKIYPIYAVEAFEITVVVTDSDVAVN